MNKLNIIIADDHLIFRTGLKKLMRQISTVGTIEEASNGREVLDLLASPSSFQLVLLDIEMPEMNGIEALEIIKQHYPSVKVVMLSSFSNEGQIEELYKSNIDGYLLKNAGIEDLKRTLSCIIEGRHYFSQEVADKLFKQLLQKEDAKAKPQIGITDREKEVLVLICEQYSTAEIAEKLNLSSRTIERFRENLLVKTGSKNAIGLVLFAISSGIARVR